MYIISEIKGIDEFSKTQICRILGFQNFFQLVIAPNCKYFINSWSEAHAHDI